MRAAFYASFLAPKKRGNRERMGQVGSSHLNEKFSFEQDATVGHCMVDPVQNYPELNNKLTIFYEETWNSHKYKLIYTH